MQSEQVVGKPVHRKEGLAKVLGAARYIDDFSMPGMIYGATVRSGIPRGRVLGIEFGPGIPWDEFTIVTARDIPGKNYIAMINNDWPCLADGFVNHPQEPILLLAHRDRHLLPQAVAAVRVEYEELPSVHSIEESESLYSSTMPSAGSRWALIWASTGSTRLISSAANRLRASAMAALSMSTVSPVSSS